MSEQKQSYGLFILRTDGHDIDVQISENYDEVKKTYDDLIQAWTNSVTEKVPFSLISPIVTTFNPNLIYEITIRPLVETVKTNTNNPYQQTMMKEGLGATRNFSSPILDSGYKSN